MFAGGKDMRPVKVKFLQSAASATWAYNRGDVIELDGAQARAFLASGVVERSDEPTGRHAYPTCDTCGSETTDDGLCFSVLCRGAWRPSAPRGPA